MSEKPSLIYGISSRHFEELIAEILTKMHYEVELTPQSRDGGFDMYAAKRDLIGTFLYIVECKKVQPPNKVGVRVVRSLHGVVEAKRATAGLIVTTSFFTKDAKAFRDKVDYRLSLVDYLLLQKWIAKVCGSIA